MADRDNANPKRNRETNRKTETSNTRSFAHEHLSTRNFRINSVPIDDDLIAALSNKHENRRARQVSEWERMTRFTVSAV